MDALAEIIDMFSDSGAKPGSGSGALTDLLAFNPNDCDFYRKVPLEPYRIFNVVNEVLVARYESSAKSQESRHPLARSHLHPTTFTFIPLVGRHRFRAPHTTVARSLHSINRSTFRTRFS